jgi:hypothetical protein
VRTIINQGVGQRGGVYDDHQRPSRSVRNRSISSSGLIPVWQQLEADVLAHAYSDVFLVITVLTVLGIPLAMLLKSGRPSRGGDAEPVEVG